MVYYQLHSLPYVCSYSQKEGDKGDLPQNYLYDRPHIPIQVSKYLAQLGYRSTTTSTTHQPPLLDDIPYYIPSKPLQLSFSFHVRPTCVREKIYNTWVAKGGMKFVEI